MTAHFTDEIRAAARRVAGQADFVTLNEEAVTPYTEALLRSRRAQMTPLDAQTLGAGDTPHEKAAYILALDAINFGSGYFELAQKKSIALEYADFALNLRRAFAGRGLQDISRWQDLRAPDCHAIFAVPAGAHPDLDRLMALFARHLNEAGVRIDAEYGGQPMQMVVAAQGSAVRLAETVGRWDGFRDMAVYKGFDVPLFKRAQIFAADIWLALGKSGAADFADIDRLTIFADNMVPHVLRHGGVLSYAPDLAARIDAGEEIPAGSAEETELRAVAIHAVECMRDAAHALGHTDICAVNLDHILWNRGYEPDLAALPRHRTLSVWY